jgi:hypothetical protein
MEKIYIDLQNGRLVKPFIELLNKMPGSFSLISGRKVIDAKSMLGIYCLDLSKPLLLQIDSESDSDMEMLDEFIIK